MFNLLIQRMEVVRTRKASVRHERTSEGLGQVLNVLCSAFAHRCQTRFQAATEEAQAETLGLLNLDARVVVESKESDRIAGV
jgi:hypothetical protein